MHSTQKLDSRAPRAAWGSGFGFVMAASGAAIGLGNLWRFPYITGENGGGLFVVIYLLAIAFVGLPILVCEILLGRAAGTSTVGVFRSLAGPRSTWRGVGGLGVAAATLVLSVYCVVAGWSLHYSYLALRGAFTPMDADEIQALFGSVYVDPGLNLFCSLLFLGITMAVVLAGVRGGIERCARILMPLLFAMLLLLLAKAGTLPGFSEAFDFVFGLHTEKLSASGILEAVGHACFTLSVGVGAMLTYGSYLPSRANIVRNALAITVLDTAIALLACLVIFPIIFSSGLELAEGPGLIFVSLPIAFAGLPGGAALATAFFGLLFFAALTSSISMLEVPVSYLVDTRGWRRTPATLAATGLIALLTVPAALTGATDLFGDGFAASIGKNWFDLVLDTVSNWMMPIGGLGIAVFAAWRLGDKTRRDQFPPSFAAGLYRGWLLVLRGLVPAAILLVFLHAVGVV